MDKFRKVSGVAAPLMINNVDTDTIIPTPWIKAMNADLGEGLFGRWRYREGDVINPVEDPEFVLNRPEYRASKFLIADQNFGCGSSREHAVWALSQFGIRCVIAISFGDIFYNNCFKNGLLPITLPEEQVHRLSSEVKASAGSKLLTVDLEACTVTGPNGRPIPFDIDPARRKSMLEGLDFIGVTLKYDSEIRAFQADDRKERPWVHWPGVDCLPQAQ